MVSGVTEFYNRTRSLVQRYHSALAISGSQASDLTQDTFLQLHRSRHLYDPRLPVTPWCGFRKFWTRFPETLAP